MHYRRSDGRPLSSSLISMGCVLGRVLLERIQGRVIVGTRMIRRLSTDRPSTKILEILNNVLQREGITEFTHVLGQGPAKGENNMGKLYRMKVNGKRNGLSEELNLICKVPPLSLERQEKFATWRQYERETFVYNRILPTFNTIQDMMGIKKKFNSPICYYACATRGSEIVIMEDMTAKGYEMSGTRKHYLEMPELESIIKELAKFHALSFAVKEHKSENYNIISDTTDILLMTESMKPSLEGAARKAMSLIDDPEVRFKYRQFAEDIFEKTRHMLNPASVEPYAVLTHGDFWGNNILLKRNIDTPTDVCFVDYQAARYTSPLADLMQLFVTAAGPETRRLHGNYMFDYYYTSLASFLEELSCDPHKYYPREIYERHLALHGGGFAAFIATYFLPFIGMPKEMLHDMDDYIRLVESNPTRRDEVFIFKNETAKKVFADKFNGILADLIHLKML